MHPHDPNLVGGARAAQAVRRSRLECRACGVICERVVYPVHCLRGGCPYTYAFREDGSTYFGCLEKVFGAELDLAPFEASPRSDPYGGLKAFRTPRQECRVTVERAYEFEYTRDRCTNPTFQRDTSEFSPEAVRQLVHGAGSSRSANEARGPLDEDEDPPQSRRSPRSRRP